MNWLMLTFGPVNLYTMGGVMGKGSKRRPRNISTKDFEDNWDKIFMKQPRHKPKVDDESNWEAQVDEVLYEQAKKSR